MVGPTRGVGARGGSVPGVATPLASPPFLPTVTVQVLPSSPGNEPRVLGMGLGSRERASGPGNEPRVLGMSLGSRERASGPGNEPVVYNHVSMDCVQIALFIHRWRQNASTVTSMQTVGLTCPHLHISPHFTPNTSPPSL